MSSPMRSNAWERGRRVAGPARRLRRYLVLCEDSKSSVLYLKKFPSDPEIVKVECFGTGMNTDSIMAEAIKRKKKAISMEAPYEHIWVVFDRDSFPGDHFYRAFDLVYIHPEITACWSNECFELWYLMHFGFRQTAIRRAEICGELTRLLGRDYKKNDATIYEALKDKLELALRHADQLAHFNAEQGRRRENPSTKVHQLIRELRKLAPEEIGR